VYTVEEETSTQEGVTHRQETVEQVDTYKDGEREAQEIGTQVKVEDTVQKEAGETVSQQEEQHRKSYSNRGSGAGCKEIEYCRSDVADCVMVVLVVMPRIGGLMVIMGIERMVVLVG